MYFGSAGCFFKWDHVKNGSMYEKYKETNLVSYRIGNIMIYTYNIAFIVNLGDSSASLVVEIVAYIGKKMIGKYNVEIKRGLMVIGTIDYIILFLNNFSKLLKNIFYNFLISFINKYRKVF